MEKLKNSVVIIYLMGGVVCIAVGFSSIVKFDTTGFFTLIFTLGIIALVVDINAKEKDKETEKILLEAKEIYSLDYSKLNNIKKIELTNKHEYFVIIRNGNNWRFPLAKNDVPHTQLDLEILDKKYQNIKIEYK